MRGLLTDRRRGSRREDTEARAFFQATLDSLPTHVAVLDEDGEVIMTNRAWVRFALDNDGVDAARGGNYLAVCDAADEESARRAAHGIREILAGRRFEFSLEYSCDSPTEERWFVMRATRYLGLKRSRVVVSHENVTMRRKIEADMAIQAALLDEVDVCIVATDAAGRITHWNRGAEHLYGWSRAEAVGGRALDLIVAADAELAGQIVNELRTRGKWEGQIEVHRKDGRVFPAYVRDRVITETEDGPPAGTIAVSVDVSERVASERALLASREYLRAVADSMGEGLFTLDNAGLLTYMNAAAEELLGWSAAELDGRVMHDVTHAQSPDGSPLPVEECPILRARAGGETVRVEDDVFFRRNGRQLPVAYTAAPFETGDGVQGCVVVFEDITERRRREESLRRDVEELAWIARCKDALAQGRFLLYAQPIVDLSSGKIAQRELLLRVPSRTGGSRARSAIWRSPSDTG